MQNSNSNFGRDLLKWWVVITIIYTILFFLFLSGGKESIGGHVAGFFGLFTPVGLLSISVLLLGSYLIGNIVAIVLMLLAISWGNKQEIHGFKKIILILLILFTVTFVADLIRTMGGVLMGGISSWDIFINGSLPKGL